MTSQSVEVRKAPAQAEAEFWDLCLYVAGQTPKSLAAFGRLKQLCEAHLAGRYHLEVTDLLEQPQRAQADQILAIPTVVRRRPLPRRTIVGDLSNTQRVLVGLGLIPKPRESPVVSY